jgi:AcrR family transcriptional regulator
LRERSDTRSDFRAPTHAAVAVLESQAGIGGRDSYERIFFAAERLFGEFGYEGVSVRDIVQAAEVSLAAVSYHFGSKHDLLMAVFIKRARQLSRARSEMLRSAEREHRDAPPVEAVLRAYIAPAILWRDPAAGKASAWRFLARMSFAPTAELGALLENRVAGLMAFRRALARALPRAGLQQISWALHFAAGLQFQCTDLQLQRLVGFSEGVCDVEDLAGVVERAIAFAAAGLRALCRGD